MENIIDTSDASCCTHCKKSLENVNPIYQTDDLLFCSKDCLADFVIEEQYSSFLDAVLSTGIADDIVTPPDIEYCTSCNKDIRNISPVYSDQHSNLFCSKNCIAKFYVEDKYKCLRDALIDIGAAADEEVENDD